MASSSVHRAGPRYSLSPWTSSTRSSASSSGLTSSSPPIEPRVRAMGTARLGLAANVRRGRRGHAMCPRTLAAPVFKVSSIAGSRRLRSWPVIQAMVFAACSRNRRHPPPAGGSCSGADVASVVVDRPARLCCTNPTTTAITPMPAMTLNPRAARSHVEAERSPWIPYAR